MVTGLRSGKQLSVMKAAISLLVLGVRMECRNSNSRSPRAHQPASTSLELNMLVFTARKITRQSSFTGKSPLLFSLEAIFLTRICSCAQIKVTGSGSGSPSKTYKIPGLYDDTMTLFNGLNLWTDSADTVKKDIANTPIGDEI